VGLLETERDVKAPLGLHSGQRNKPSLKPVADVLITDLDNTLWDWVHLWSASFTGLMNVLVEEGKLDRETLLDEAREIHQRHRTSEYFLLLDELPSVRGLAERDAARVKPVAIAAAQDARKEVLELYPKTLETLEKIRESGSLVVAYTESMAFATAQRIRKLDLDGVIQYLYSSPDHDFPNGASPKDLRRHSDDYYSLKQTEHRHVERGVIKPSAEILRKIMSDVGAEADRTVYVGDNLMKDVTMAQEAGVHDVLAKFGHASEKEEYELLRRVTHWSPEDVQREKDIVAGGTVTASYELSEDISEVFELFDFSAHEGVAHE
jgi:FMN phosphatase YigB (HAD superfamily)